MTIPTIDQINPSQSGKEALLNELFDALRASFTLTKWDSASVGLTIWFYGGRFAGTDLGNQSLTLPASTAAIYIEANATTGAIAMSTTGYTSGKISMGIAVTSASGVLSYTPESVALTGSTYVLPIASVGALGGIKVGANLAIDGAGVLSATVSGYTLPTATATVLGGVKIGANLSISAGVLSSATGVSLASANVWTKNQSVVIVALTDAATITTDASLSNNFKVTLAGNRTLANPTNLTEGMWLHWAITQDATGSRTLTFGTLFKWQGGTAPVLSTPVGAKDTISAYYDGSALLASVLKAFG